MIRRSHKKSRHGCIECKEGHKKCDETRPACVNCVSAKKTCSYTSNPHLTYDKTSNDNKFIIHTVADEQVKASSSSVSPRIDSNPGSEPLLAAPASLTTYRTDLNSPPVNMLHIELFHNLTSNALFLFVDKDPSKDQWLATTLRYAFSYPYLMYEFLAGSAFHLSTTDANRYDFYVNEATNLQAHALTLFNASTPTVTATNVIPAFLFAGGLGLHFFCDTFRIIGASSDPDAFLDRLTQSMRLLRGIRALIGDSWDLMRTSDIAPLLQVDETVVPRDDPVTQAFRSLFTRISQSLTLSPIERSVYSEAITGLIWVYESQPLGIYAGSAIPRAVTTWQITVSAEYTQFLCEKRSEALVIMAYFAILLHAIRRFWAVGDAGRTLLLRIREFLGEEWDDWLVAPNQIILDQ